MSLARVSVRHAQNYYRQDNYYSKSNHDENSAWFGRGAAQLGLRGSVDNEHFASLLAGETPDGKALLTTRTRQYAGEQRAGLDMTFSAPKSVSLAALVGDDQRLETAHREAVIAALRVVEERYSLTRRGGHAHRTSEVAGNLIVAQFHHDTSRAKDPQLHTHCVAINAVQRSDGEWRSLLNDGIFANSKLLGLIYKNALAREVQKLGYTVQSQSDGSFEIEGYTREQLRAFSKRREQILAEGGVSPEAARRAVKRNRAAKGRELPRTELLTRWQDECRVLGIRHPQSQSFRKLEVDHQELVSAAIHHASERDVSFRPEALERFALESQMGQVDLQEFAGAIDCAQSRFDLIACAGGRYTTAQAIKTEEQILAAVARGKNRCLPISPEIPSEIKDNLLGLSLGQKSALELSLTTRDQFFAWQGVAGAGKTFAMNELRKHSVFRGYEVRGFAPSAEAAKVLSQEAGINAATAASLLLEQEAAGHRRQLWIIDEAGLLSARDTEALLARAERVQARVIFVGDTRQLASVEAGNPFKLMQQKGIETAYLTESRRQKTHELKVAARAMAAGDMRLGLSHLDASTVEYRREATRIKHVASDYLKLGTQERQNTLILAGTNRERQLLTEAIRRGLRDSGELGEGVKVRALERKDLTRAEARAGLKIETGDRLIFHKDYRRAGIAKGTIYEVLDHDHRQRSLYLRDATGRELRVAPQTHAAFQVYCTRELDLAAGDRLRWTKNDPRLGLRNGQDLGVEQIAESIELRGKDGQKIILPKSAYLHLDHNYVSTVYASQGKTAERVLISVDQTFGREAMYVAVTRAKESLKIYTEDKQKLMRLAETPRAKQSALELVPQGTSETIAIDEKQGRSRRLH